MIFLTNFLELSLEAALWLVFGLLLGSYNTYVYRDGGHLSISGSEKFLSNLNLIQPDFSKK